MKTTTTVPLWKTCEYVSPAHPDKLCDQISDSILDQCLSQDPHSRVACEVMWGHGKIWITGEITTTAIIDYQHSVDQVLTQNRYDPSTYTLEVHINKQSNQIAQWVDTWWAWDQGIMVWYATRETPELMPLELMTSRSILQDLRALSPLTRDAKAQVTTRNWDIDVIVVSAERLDNNIILDYLQQRFGKQITYHINAAWSWDNGWFMADAGLTWRKIAVDNYGPQIPIWGWAFSGKDRTKVDRSAAYMARYLACEHLQSYPQIQWTQIKIAYCIGIVQPVMVSIETNEGMSEYTGQHDLSPRGISDFLKLTQAQFTQTAQRWHFGCDYLWDKVPNLEVSQ